MKSGFATEAKSDEPQVSIEADEGVFPPQTPRSPLFAMSDAEMTAFEAAGASCRPVSYHERVIRIYFVTEKNSSWVPSGEW